jgi:ribosome-binding factor A
MHKSQVQIGREIRKVLGPLVDELRDPNLGEVSIVEVVLSPDLLHARVYFDVNEDAAGIKRNQEILEKAAGYLRHQLSRQLRLPSTPTLLFRFDEALRRSERVIGLLDEMGEDEGE